MDRRIRASACAICVVGLATLVEAQGQVSKPFVLADGQFAILRCEEMRGSTVRLSILTVTSSAEAETVVTELTSGQSSSALATRRSTHPSKSQGGALGTLEIGDLAEPFHAALKGVRCPRAAATPPAPLPSGLRGTTAARAPQLILAAKAGDIASAKAELGRKADPNAKDGEGMTPLMWAALYGHQPVVAALLAAGARIDDADSGGGTAHDYATLGRHDAVVSFMASRGGKSGFGQANSLDNALKLYAWTGSRPDSVFKYAESRAPKKQ